MSDPDSPASNSAPAGPTEDPGEERQPFMQRLKAAVSLLIPRRPQPRVSINRDPNGDVQQRLLLANVRRMGEMRVSDAMVPRADVVAIEAEAGFVEIFELFRNVGHSRLPVFRETLDDPLGFIHVKDLFLAFGPQSDEAKIAEFKATSHLRRTLTVPPSMPCGTLLQAMQAQRMHMALVIDEFGGVDGLVTIEDLLELIVGDIEDEHDTANGAAWSKAADGTYLASARAYLDEFEEAVGIELLDDPEEDVDTLGGLVFMLCNRIPHARRGYPAPGRSRVRDYRR